MDVLHLTANNQDAVIQRVVSLIKRGGVVVLPTDTVYGLVGDCLRDAAVKKIFRIKARSHQKALPVFIRDFEMARHYAYIDAKLKSLVEEMWPGPTTLVFKKKETMPDLVTGAMKTVALRIPEYELVNQIAAGVGQPLVGTSANLSGNEPAQSAAEVQNTFIHHVPRPDAIVDGGRLPPSPPSTILDMTDPKNPKILRMGAITKEKLDEYLKMWKK